MSSNYFEQYISTGISRHGGCFVSSFQSQDGSFMMAEEYWLLDMIVDMDAGD